MAGTGHDRGQPASAGASLEAVPAEVDRLADARGLGELVGVRHGVTPMHAMTVGWGIAAVSAVLMIVLGVETNKTSLFSFAHSVLHALTLAFLLTAVGGIGFGIRGLVAGTRAQYLYAAGIVQTSRSGPRAVAWLDVVRLTSIYRRGDRSDVGQVVGYRLEACDGTSFVIPLALVNGTDAFVDRIVSALRHHNRPII